MNQDRIGSVVEHAVCQLTEGNGDAVACLLQTIPVGDLAEAVAQECEDGVKVGDYSLLHVMSDVLSRALSLHGDSL